MRVACNDRTHRKFAFAVKACSRLFLWQQPAGADQARLGAFEQQVIAMRIECILLKARGGWLRRTFLAENPVAKAQCCLCISAIAGEPGREAALAGERQGF